jgi:hypothetical protein
VRCALVTSVLSEIEELRRFQWPLRLWPVLATVACLLFSAPLAVHRFESAYDQRPAGRAL